MVRLLKPREAAQRLAVCQKTVHNLIRCGALSAVNVGQGQDRPRFRVPEDALETFLVRRATGGQDDAE